MVRLGTWEQRFAVFSSLAFTSQRQSSTRTEIHLQIGVVRTADHTCERPDHRWCAGRVAGDYNVVPTPDDIYPTRSLDKNALVQPASREAFQRLLRQGWTDALRKLHPSGPLWTFWDYKFERWQADKGMRLDHLLLSPQFSRLLIDAGVDRWVREEDNASDHAPAWITLKL
jgi:exodeoxyribonuclease III